MSKPVLVALTGAGISAESGIATFRGNGGLWENHTVEEVASIDGWMRNPALVLAFYNARRDAAMQASPNPGHLMLKQLEDHFDVRIITQNVDTLHEKAGSSKILHLHGRLDEKRSEKNPNLIDAWTEAIAIGDLAPDGCQWRPNIVWFGEMVPAMQQAIDWVREADIFVVIGTSLQVYPAAGLVHEVPLNCSCFLIDPQPIVLAGMQHFTQIAELASTGVAKLAKKLLL